MNQYFASVARAIGRTYSHAWGIPLGIAIILIGGASAYAMSQRSAPEDVASDVVSVSTDAVVGIVGADIASTTPGASWPAELIASDLSQVQPQQEGVVADWNVHVGQRVSQGQVLGHISAPPNTPDLVNMVADRTEALTKAQDGAVLADSYTEKEQARLQALQDSITDPSQTASSTYTALIQLREEAQTKEVALRSFIERAFAGEVAMVTNAADWHLVKYGSFNRSYGTIDPSVQNAYESEMLSFAGLLKQSTDAPIDEAQIYFALAVRLGTLSTGDPTLQPFETQAAADQKEFLDMLADYKNAEAAVSDKETEYKLDIADKSAEVEKDRGAAHVEAEAAQASYDTVVSEVSSGRSIVAPRSGTISAIYKKTGDLVSPDMVMAVVSGDSTSGVIVRMHIPNDIKRPNVGDEVSVTRPGFPTDVRKAKLVGIGTTVDDSGTYMADAELEDASDWPAGTSVRVLAPSDTDTVTIPSSALRWSDTGSPLIWRVSDAGRIYSSEITIGRTLGTTIEVYGGLKKGDRYIKKNSADIRENMMLDELTGPQTSQSDGSGDGSKKSGGMGNMPGMDM